MATISEGADVHTLIVMFTVDPTQQETLVDIYAEWQRNTASSTALSRAPFTAARTVHASRSTSSGARRRTMEAVLNTPEGQAQLAESSRIADRHGAQAHVYQVVSVTQAGQPA
jgi:hypothetical protein